MLPPEQLLPPAGDPAGQWEAWRSPERMRRRLVIAGAVAVLAVGSWIGQMVWPAAGPAQGPRVISAGAGPDALAISPDGQTLYVADYGNPDLSDSSVPGAGDTVTPVDLRTGRPGRSITVGSLPDWLTLAPAHRTLYVFQDPAYSDGDVVPVNLASGVAGPPMGFAEGAEYGMMSPDQRTLYVAADLDYGQNLQVVPVDVASGRRGAPITFPKYISGLVVSPDGETLYGGIEDGVRQQGGEIFSVDLRTHRVGAPIRLDNHPWTLAFSPDGKWLYVVAGIVTPPSAPLGPQALFVISVASQKVVKSVALKALPDSVAVAPDGRMLYIQNDDTTITPVSTATWQLGATIVTTRRQDARGAVLSLGPLGSTLVISPDGRTLYALNGTGVAVIPLARLRPHWRHRRRPITCVLDQLMTTVMGEC
jgi:DNA-binding beta-propeller fold protein YncE